MQLFLTLVIIGIGLSMDCFAVTVGAGVSGKRNNMVQNLYIALVFAIFHFFMPLLGWFIGDAFKEYVRAIDHYIAFALLLIIGGKMVYEAFQSYKKDAISFHNHFFVFGLALATSIDALIVGMSLALLDFNLMLTAAVISFSAFVFSFAGFYIGRRFACYCGNKAEILGGIILIAIGTKILIEHLIKGI